MSVAGNAPPSLRAIPEREFPSALAVWLGIEVGGLYRSSGLFSPEISTRPALRVIEALACGLPVAAYATGALPEMLAGQGGLCVPWARILEAGTSRGWSIG